jgi:hypothetical protein
MKVFEELTVWTTPTPNHIYLLNNTKDKMYAYVRAGTRDVIKLAKPLKIDPRGRKFKEITNTFGFLLEEDRPEGQTWEVKGSKGDLYTVSLIGGNYSCTCSGFKFRGQCRHIESVKNV